MSALIAGFFMAIAGISIGRDITSHPQRMDEWERQHPGATYVRGWKRMSDAERSSFS